MGCCGNMSMRRGGFGAGYVYKYMGEVESIEKLEEISQGFGSEQFGYIYKIKNDENRMVIWDNGWFDLGSLRGPRGYKGDKGDKGDKGEDGNDIEARNMASDAKKSAQDAYNRADDAHGVAVIARDMAANADSRSENALYKAEKAQTAADEAKQYAETVESALTQYVDDVTGDMQTHLQGKVNTEDFSRLQQEVDLKAYSGQTLASMEELEALPLPGDVSEGVVYTVKERVATNGYKVTGKVSELFYTGYGNEVGYTADEIYAYRLKVAVPDACVAEKDLGYGGLEKYVRIYNVNGEVVAAYNREVHIDHPLGYPLYFLIENLGASSVDDIVTFYCGYAENGVYPDAIKFEEIERAFYYNGNEWVELAPASAIGDIDASLDAILAMDEKLLGGDA